MSIAAMNPFLGELIQTSAPGITCSWCQLALFEEAPVAVSDTAVLASTPLTASPQNLITGFNNPDVVRNIVIKGEISASTGNVVITGTDFAGNSIMETLALNGTTAVAGIKAFATIAEIDLPVSAGSGDGVSVGVGSKLGLPFTLTKNTVLKAYNDDILETTEPTVTVDPLNICNNTITFASTLSGNAVAVYVMIPG